ncbi:TonB family protein [Enterobacteriaceae bacterium H4N4]|uniref:TonB family protein n=1 Tax=Silvania confinis TaxID=2926470 RepID=A0A9J6QNW6_9ENTR|nr:TonB family protein [Silvania confinis]MCU6670982.1 TonB family protein [Silvania confinis]
MASVLFHAALALPFIVHFSRPQPEATPAAVMVQYSPEFEVAVLRTDLPPGVSQQRKVEAMTEEERTHNQDLPKLLVQEEAELKIAAAKPEPKARKKPDIKKKSQREQKEEKGNSTTTSLAAPPVQTVQTQRTAAPLDTDAMRISQSKISWESLVKGKINKMRNYPEDARRRKRTGTAVITFSVDARGEILTTKLVSSSGTLSLDKAALTALINARPLPPPPEELVRQGVQKVTLPVEFGLLDI